jgi:hypothetical protein
LQELLNLDCVYSAENEIKSNLRMFDKISIVKPISTGIVVGWDGMGWMGWGGNLIKVQFDI